MATDFHIRPLQAGDRRSWEQLARGYKAFCQSPATPEEYEAAWRRLLQAEGIHGIGLWQRGELIGIAHYLFHPSTWATAVCYLQDMFVLPTHRGNGAGRALIEAVRDHAQDRGAARFYWLTQESNAVARGLYDQLARFSGFIRYDCPLPEPDR